MEIIHNGKDWRSHTTESSTTQRKSITRHYEAVADIDVTHPVLNEFDKYIAEHPELYKINSKINIVLTPISSIRHDFVA